MTRLGFHNTFRVAAGLLTLVAAAGWAIGRLPAEEQASVGYEAASPLWLVPDEALSADEPPLARAIARLDNDDPATALPVFESAEPDPVTGGYATVHAGRARLALDDAEGALADARRVIGTETTRSLRQAASWLAADALAAVEDWPAAIDVLRDLIALEPPDAPRAWEQLAQAAEAAGDSDQAFDAYRRLRLAHPLSGEAERATAAIDRMGGLPVEAANAADELGRAEQLFAGGRYRDARSTFETWRALAPAAGRADIDLRLMQCDFYLGRYRESLAAADRIAEGREDLRVHGEFYALSALRGLGREAEYLRRLETFLGRHPSDPLAERALNELGSYYIIEDEDAQAAEVFADLYERFPQGRYADRAAWKAGWWAYKTGEYRTTVRLFESASSAFPRADYRSWWLYWIGRSYDRLGERGSAVEAFRRTIVFYRNSYYGRAAARELARLTGTTVDIAATSATGRLVLEPGAAPSSTPLIQALLRAGLYADAVREIEEIQREGASSAPVLEATRAWALVRAGELRPGINAMRRAYPQFMAAGGETLPAALLRVIFPIDYWELISSEARTRGLDPFLMTALVAQESTFQADVQSAANAWGLMQILPATGQRIAPDAGIRGFNASMLTDPETNVKIGMTYFAALVRQFGSVAPALAAYNAGEHRVVAWLEERPDLAPDEFIDDIPFPETLNYVKRILGTAEDYRLLYPGLAESDDTGARP